MIAAAVGEQWRDYPDALLWKAQLCQESRLDPNAVSPVGAQGLAQIMPATYAEIVRTLKWDSTMTAFSPERAIRAGAYYQGRMRRMWKPDGRTGAQRNDWGLCAYNAGAGSCIKAQARCGQPTLWEHAAPCLADITGRYATETLTYVTRINQYWRDLSTGVHSSALQPKPTRTP